MVRVRAVVESVRNSLFVVPLLFVVTGVVLALVTVELDEGLTEGGAEVPLVVSSTVDSARAVLSTVAAATVTVAGIAFSIALLIFQMASSQYSPRVIHGLFRDRYNKRIMGLVVGTFTYCLVVLRSVRGPVEDGGEAVVPTLSVNLAVLLGIVSILGIVAFIDHSAHLMDISRILQDVTDDARDQLRAVWVPREDDGEAPAPGVTLEDDLEPEPAGAGFRIDLDRDGWIQQLDAPRLLAVAPPGGVVVLATAPGRYGVEGTELCTIWPPPPDSESARRAALATVQVGSERTLPGDVSYGIRQLVDVALKALSPGVNDPTTAQDAIFHLVAVLREALVGDPPPRVLVGDGDRRMVQREAASAADLVDLACDELRRAAGPHPAVCVYLLEALRLLAEGADGRADPDALAAIRRQAALVVDECARHESLDVDVRAVRTAHDERFGGGHVASRTDRG